MKLTKAERKERRKRIIGKVGNGIAKTVGFAVGAVADAVPVPGVNNVLKGLPPVVKNNIPQVSAYSGIEDTITKDVIPLIRTIRVLRDIIERFLNRFL